MTNNHPRCSLFYILLLCALFLCACSAKTNAPVASNEPQLAEQPAERIVKDALGHEVKVPAHPQRVIASYMEDHLLALGVRPIAQWSIAGGKSVQNYLQDSLHDIPPIPSELPFEAVMSFAPDLILMENPEMVAGDKYTQYSKIAPTYTVGNGKNNDWRQVLLTIGEVLGKTEKARQVLEDYDREAAKAREQLAQSVGRKSAAALWVTAKNTYVVHEKLSSGNVLYRDLDMKVPSVVKEISASANANWNPISSEKLAELDADYLFIVNSRGITKEEMMKDPIWSRIPAVKNGHVYEFDTQSSWLYSGAIANQLIIEDVLNSIVKK